MKAYMVSVISLTLIISVPARCGCKML